MRQLATFPRDKVGEARLFADYLGSISIETQVEETRDGAELWVRDEDHLDRAREEHEGFLKNPSAARFQQGAKQARQERSQRARKDEEIRSKEQALHDRIHQAPRRRWTVILIVLSVACTLMREDKTTAKMANEYLFIISLKTVGDKVVWLDPQFVGVLRDVRSGEVWRLVTPIFVHFGVFHLLFNMLWLLTLGTAIETKERAWRFLLLVLGIAILSNLAQYWFSDFKNVDGAWKVEQFHPLFGGMSGVVFGLFGYVWMKSRYQPSLGYYMSQQTVMLMIFWLFLCMTGFVGNIANVAHLVGLFVGMIWGYLGALINRNSGPTLRVE